jgi:hypothetical protein
MKTVDPFSEAVCLRQHVGVQHHLGLSHPAHRGSWRRGRGRAEIKLRDFSLINKKIYDLYVRIDAGSEILLFNRSLRGRVLLFVCWVEYGEDHQQAAAGFYASGLSYVRQPHVARAHLSQQVRS